MNVSIIFAVFVTVIIFKFDGTLGCYNQLIKAHDKLHSIVMGFKLLTIKSRYVNCTIKVCELFNMHQ